MNPVSPKIDRHRREHARHHDQLYVRRHRRENGHRRARRGSWRRAGQDRRCAHERPRRGRQGATVHLRCPRFRPGASRRGRPVANESGRCCLAALRCGRGARRSERPDAHRPVAHGHHANGRLEADVGPYGHDGLGSIFLSQSAAKVNTAIGGAAGSVTEAQGARRWRDRPGQRHGVGEPGGCGPDGGARCPDGRQRPQQSKPREGDRTAEAVEHERLAVTLRGSPT